MTDIISGLMATANIERELSEWVEDNFPSGPFRNWLSVSFKRGRAMTDCKPDDQGLAEEILRLAESLPTTHRDLLVEYLDRTTED